VRRAAGGVPLFVEEVVRSLVARHGAEALERLGPDAVLMPPLVRELLRERVERLPAATVTLLASAAMIGDSFELPLLLALVELEPTELLVRLEPALASGQLECHAPHAYRFAQPFLRRVLYDDLPALQRIALHHRLEMLELTRHDDAGSHAAVARLVERFAGRS
jgi:predicted ATPase